VSRAAPSHRGWASVRPIGRYTARVDNPSVGLRARLSLAVATTVIVALAELGTFFCFPIHLGVAGLLTVFVLMVLGGVATAWLGARGGFLIAVTSLGCIPATAILATWDLRRTLGHFQGSSDFEDLLVFLLLLAGFAASTNMAVRRSSDALAAPPATRRALLAALVIAVALGAGAVSMRGSIQTAPSKDGDAAAVVIVAVWLGLVLASGLGIAARRTRLEHELLASGACATHTGNGWLAFNDGTPPAHRPELAGQPEGPVVVRDWAGTTGRGYRDAPTAGAPPTVTFGTPESIRSAGAWRAASQEAIGVAVLAFSLLPTVPLPLVATFTDDMLQNAPLGEAREHPAVAPPSTAGSTALSPSGRGRTPSAP